MGVGQAAHDPAGDKNGHLQRAGQSACWRSLVGELLQVDAADQLHGDEIHAVGFAQVVGLNDVGVDQVGHQLGFADEVLDERSSAWRSSGG